MTNLDLISIPLVAGLPTASNVSRETLGLSSGVFLRAARAFLLVEVSRETISGLVKKRSRRIIAPLSIVLPTLPRHP
jgi:hypothetical protein